MGQENATHRYPVGVQVFETMRTDNYLYVDKTDYIWRMTHEGGSYYFLSRPRRFGKTLLVSTLEAYFQGRRELFEGLALAQREADWIDHPVLRFDLSRCKDTTPKALLDKFNTIFTPIEQRYGIKPYPSSPGSRLDALVHAAVAQSGRKAVVLIDEYDAPLLNVLHDAQSLQAFRDIMREFYSPLKALEPLLRFVFLTGVSKFSQLSVFSELNNLRNISMLPSYAGICGITEQELSETLHADVEHLGIQLGIDAAHCHAALKSEYDGYHFCAASPDIYNPFSLMTAFANEQISSYWFASGTPTSLVNMLCASAFAIPELDGITATEASFDAPAEALDSPVPFMYQSGYLTIKGYDPVFRDYTLGIPNREVSEGLYGVLLPAYTATSDIAVDSFIARFGRAILLHNDLDQALLLLRSFLAAIPYDMAPKNEKAFQTVLYLIFKVVGTRIATEVRTATGRIDAVIDTPQARYIIELKYRKANAAAPTARDALGQIDSKDYLLPFQSDGAQPLVKAGVVYEESERTIGEDWIIAQD